MCKLESCSVIVPVFNEAQNIAVFHHELLKITATEPIRWEFIFVDDGSTDGSFAVLRDLASADDRVRTIKLSRNFGSHAAMAAGLKAATGDAAVFMAADLQDPPHVLHEFLARQRQGYNVVWAVRTDRKDPFWRKAAAGIFYRIIRRVALPDYPGTGTGSFCLIDRAVINAFDAFRERNRVTFGLIAWSGFRQTQVPYSRAERRAGVSGWTLPKMIKAAFDTLLGFSYAPVRMISLLGVFVSLLSFLGGAYVVGSWLIYGVQAPGWPSLLLSILLLGGVQLMVLGVLGEYLWRILDEVRGRPLYIVDEQTPLPASRDERLQRSRDRAKLADRLTVPDSSVPSLRERARMRSAVSPISSAAPASD